MEPRAPSLAALAAAALLAAHGQASRLVTTGYPYGYECPRAGRLDVVDRWKMDACNCTSYVAWALERNGYRIDWFVAGAMDAKNWPNVARRHGLRVGRAPSPGAVAVWPEWGRFGHVALVTAARADGTFDVAEYNRPGGVRFGFDRRSAVSPAGVRFVVVPRGS